ncbi:MAG TPA: SDR family oxidoreductase [Chloroflexota bacterium]|nr:SDR family oxidoreductase [Chloroflexota bacterium]
MKVVVFGASGKTGREIVKQGLQGGHEVTAFVRDPAKLDITHERLRAAKGDVRDAAAVAEAVAGQDVVLSALGPAKPDFNTMTLGMKNVLAGMKQHGVRRLVTLTGAGVPDPNDRPGPFNHFIVFLLKRLSPGVLEDSLGGVERVRASDVDWTVVRVGRLNDGPQTGNVQVGWVGTGPKPFISRADVAAFMLREAAERRHVRQSPMIGS